MPTPILMPALSPTMEQGKLAKWLKKEGDKVSSGDAIAEIETDKATMEVEAVDEGTIGKIMIAEGTEGVAVNTPIAVLLSEGEDAAALKGYGSEPPQRAPQKAAPPQSETVGAKTPSPQPPPQGGDGEKRQPSPQEAREKSAQAAPETQKVQQRPSGKANGHGRLFASPLARRVAAQAGIELSMIKGSGPHGRIVKHDVDEARQTGVTAPTAPAAGAMAQNGMQALVPSRSFPAAMPDEQILALYEKGSYEIRPLDNMRKTIAVRLSQAAASIPHFRLNVDCEIEELLEARQRLNARSPKDGPNAYKLSVNDFVIKAMGLALQRVPDANATFTERGLLIHKSSDIGVAVALEGGLFTPIIRSVEKKTLAQISNDMKELAERARRRRLAPHEYQGGTTAISNLGMFGIDNFDAVINPPHATILAVGRGEKRAIVKGDKIVAATMMSCTLSCDHRVVDGALGAQLLTAFKGFIEEPVTMLV
ncbi:MAG: pyruvate dehydrogenase complex dihydrolipoamide acetyltransferase [Rhodomicrobium sp.]